MPHVHVNCAMTLDGAIGGPGRTPLRISNDEDLDRVHALRAAVDAVLVGVGTVVADDPKLTVKWERAGRAPGREPLRVVLDPGLRTPATSHVAGAGAATVFFARSDAPERPEWDVVRVPAAGRALDLTPVLAALDTRGVARLLVEGGASVIGSFLAARLVDRLTVFVAPRAVGDRDAPRIVEAPLDLSTWMRADPPETVGDGVLMSWSRVR